DDIDLLCNKCADGRNLIFLLLLPIGELQLYTEILGRLLDRERVGGAPPALCTDLGKAHDELLIGFGRLRCGRIPSDRRGGRASTGYEDAGECQDAREPAHYANLHRGVSTLAYNMNG